MPRTLVQYYQLNLANSIVSADIAPSGIATAKLTDGAKFIKSDGTVVMLANFDMGAFRIVNMANAINPQDAVTLAQLQSVQSGLDVKNSCRVATTTGVNINIASPGSSIDGIGLAPGNRVLLKNQTTASQNGIYVWTGAVAALTRALDADTNAEVNSGMFTFIEEGTINAGSGWILTTPDPITLGTTGLTFSQFSGGAGYTAGDGLVLVGNQFNVVGTANRITVGAAVDIASNYVGQASITTLGSITTGTWQASVIGMAYGGTGANLTPAAGGIVYSSGAAMAISGIGTAGQVLISGGGGAPTWMTATSTNTPNTIVLRDGAGNFAAGTITASLTGAASLNVLKAGDTMTGTLVFTAGTVAVSPVRFQSGSLLITPVYGAMEFLTDLLYITINAGTPTRKPLLYADLTNITGTVPVGSGGTGMSVYAIGDIIYASATTVLARLPQGAASTVLLSGTAPSWGKVPLTTHISGILPVANGGTGVSTTAAAGNTLIGNGTTYVSAKLTAGTGITIVSVSGSITISADAATTVTYTDIITREQPPQTPDGSITNYILANIPITGTERVFVNGVMMDGASNDYSINYGTKTITFIGSAIPQLGDKVRVSYFI